MPLLAIPWLEPHEPFPSVERALPNGLLAAGADLSQARLLEAYKNGIFPWYNQEEPILWWSPHPRTILKCADFKQSKSLAKKCRQIARSEFSADRKYHITTNTAFSAVIRLCAQTRQFTQGTWISEDIMQAYTQLHENGHAHSIEVWLDNELVGGLYGVKIGAFFFGESMFSLITDASKIALFYLTRYLSQRHNIHYIDCQQETAHLLSLGAKNVDRAAFQALLYEFTSLSTPSWPSGQLSAAGTLHPQLS